MFEYSNSRLLSFFFQALKEVVEACRPGVNASYICLLGDHLVTDLMRLRHPARAHQLHNATC